MPWISRNAWNSLTDRVYELEKETGDLKLDLDRAAKREIYRPSGLGALGGPPFATYRPLPVATLTAVELCEKIMCHLGLKLECTKSETKCELVKRKEEEK